MLYLALAMVVANLLETTATVSSIVSAATTTTTVILLAIVIILAIITLIVACLKARVKVPKVTSVHTSAILIEIILVEIP